MKNRIIMIFKESNSGKNAKQFKLSCLLFLLITLYIGHASSFFTSSKLRSVKIQQHIGIKHLVPTFSSKGQVLTGKQDKIIHSNTEHSKSGVCTRIYASSSTNSNSKQDSKTLQLLQEKLSREWELDCYSRPVVGSDGKKLWELLITDGNGDFKHIEQIPSNMVNSRELRKIIEKVIDEVPSSKKPKIIRFFRKSMFNMINIALKGVKAKVIPSRCTQTLFNWIGEREKEVYPKMEGYNAAMRDTTDAIFSLNEPAPMPEGLFGDKYAFVALPVELFRNGEINYTNVGPGRLFELNEKIPDNEMIQGILIFSPRAQNIAAWLASMELSTLKADFNRKQIIMEMGIDNYYLFGTINEARKAEAANFEKGKQRLNGVHFVGVQTDPDADGIEGFFLLKEQPAY